MSSSLVESSISAPAADPYKHRRPPYAEEADLLKEGSRIRHDSRKVASCLLKMARSGL